MGNTNSNTSNIVNQVNNNFLTTTSNVCVSNASVNISGVVGTVSVLGGAKGDIDFANVDGGSVTATCSIDQQISQSAAAILSAEAEQEIEATKDFISLSIIGDKNINKSDILQSMVNNLVTSTSNNCNATASTSIVNSAVNITKTGGSGNIRAFCVSNDTTAPCSISNIVAQESYADMSAKVDQRQKIVGMFSALAAAIVSIMIIGIIGLVVLFGGGAIITGKYKKTTPAPNNYELGI